MPHVRVETCIRIAPEMRDVAVSCNDVDALVAFLEALDGTGYEDEAPASFPL